MVTPFFNYNYGALLYGALLIDAARWYREVLNDQDATRPLPKRR